MALDTKYNLGELVFHVHRCAVQDPPTKCPACEEGKVELRGELYRCPSCNGKAEVVRSSYGHIIGARGFIGKITAEHYLARSDEQDGPDGEDIAVGTPVTRARYMLDVSGIHSGTLYEERDLWPTKEEAQAECDRRNGYRGPREVLR